MKLFFCPSLEMSVVNRHILGLKPSATLAINQKVTSLRNEGREIVHFGFGQSPFPIHQRIVDELIEHADNNNYLPTRGLKALRESIAGYFARYYGLETQPGQILVGPGSKELLYQTILILEGSFLIPKGSWVSYGPQIRAKGTDYKVLATNFGNNFKLLPGVLDEYCSLHNAQQWTLILNSPNNPTGAAYTEREFEALAEVCRKHDIIVLSDEIYSQINFEQFTTPSMAAFYPERTFVFGGLSKIFSAGGYRLGYMRLPTDFANLENTFQSLFSETFSAVTSPVQYAAVEAFNMHDQIEQYIKRNSSILKVIANYLYDELTDLNIECTEPQGAFYLMIGFNQYRERIKDQLGIASSSALARYILENYHVAVLPGSDFYFPPEDLFFRLAFVDFDGKMIPEQAKFDIFKEQHIAEYCPNIVKGIEQLKAFVRAL